MTKILIPFLLSILSYYWILIFRFCHPYPKSEYYFVFGIQALISFIAYLISVRFGRIIIVISGVTLVRIGSILKISSLVSIMGVFFGAVFAILIRECIDSFQNRKNKKEINADIQYLNPYFFLILFLCFLTLERFLVYFGSPYLNGFGILETMYVKGLSSKLAYALSMETITNLLFPLVYFYLEYSRNEKIGLEKNLKDGILFAIGIQFLIILIQIFWNRNFLADNTNLSLEANRAMGLFRDSGSSTWILPVLCFLSYKRLLQSQKYIFLILLIGLQLLTAPYQGRGFWLLFFVGILLLTKDYFLEIRKLSQKNFIYSFGFIILSIILIVLIPKNPNGTLARLLLIPSHFLDLIRTGENPFLSFDPQRYYFNLAAWKVFLKSPFFGTGIGSFIVNLKDPTLGLFIPEQKNDNPSFYLGILSEVGILGLILISLSFINQLLNKENIFLLLLLGIALTFGYHVVQSDSAFVLLLIFFVGLKEKEQISILEKNKTIAMLFLLILFLLHLTFQIYRQEKLPEFRNVKLGEYQLLAYEVNLGKENYQYHTFKGKTIWALTSGVNSIEVDAFLNESTSKKNLKQRWSILNQNRKILYSFEVLLEKNKSPINLVRVPANGYYLQVEELDEKGNLKFYGDVPFCIPVIHFTEKNEFM